MNDRPGPLAELALAAHEIESEAGRLRLDAEREAAQANRRARERDPVELGLEECPDCGWWRDPVPEPALRSHATFQAWLRSSKVRCLCTTDRCFDCGEPMFPDRPAPTYYSPERRGLVRSGGFPAAMRHRFYCRRG
jgi:hypothetical protein